MVFLFILHVFSGGIDRVKLSMSLEANTFRCQKCSSLSGLTGGWVGAGVAGCVCVWAGGLLVVPPRGFATP